MGACCSSAMAESDRMPVIFYCPQTFENETFPSTRSNISVISPGILVDTNLDMSIPDTYQAPPPPTPYDNKTSSVTPLNSHILGKTLSVDAAEVSDTCDDLKKSNDKGKIVTVEVSEIEPHRLKEHIDSGTEEDDCPICLEEYDIENPRMVTKCEHQFHLSCILEWMERSDVCPICDQTGVFDYTFSK